MIFTSLLLLSIATILWWRAASTRPMAAVKAGLLMTGLVLCAIYLGSDAMTGSGINDAVLFHILAGIEGAAYEAFSGLIISIGVLLLASAIIAIIAYRQFLLGERSRLTRPFVLGGWLALGASVLVNPAIPDLANLYDQLVVSSDEENISMPETFLSVDEIQFERPPKNLIVLNLEQVERTYLDNARFPGLMPGLSTLAAKALDFSDIKQVDGTGWSIAGVTAEQCGVPLVGRSAGNAVPGMVEEFLPSATCLGDLLSDQGYRLEHMIGSDLAFAGWGNFYKNHGFSYVAGRDLLIPSLEDPTYLSPWGLHDDSFLELVEDRLEILSREKSPYALFVNTLDTHNPHGHPSASCNGISYGDGSNQLLDTLHCTDRLVTAFVDRILSDPAYQDTVIILRSDHLAMPNSIWDQLSAMEESRRNLFLALNTDAPAREVDVPGSTLDIGATILRFIGAPIDGLGLGRDLLGTHEPISTDLKSANETIHSTIDYLNTLWLVPEIDAGISIDVDAMRLKLRGKTTEIPAIIYLDESMAVEDIPTDLHGLSPQEWIIQGDPLQRFIWVGYCSEMIIFNKELEFVEGSRSPDICAALGATGSDSVSVLSVSGRNWLAPEEISAALDYQSFSSANLTRRLKDLIGQKRSGAEENIRMDIPNLPGYLAIRSSALGQGPSYLVDLLSGSRMNLNRGISLIGIDATRAPVRIDHVDPCSWPHPGSGEMPNLASLATSIANHRTTNDALAIVVHDSAHCHEGQELGHLKEIGLGDIREGTALNWIDNVGYRMPYISILTDDGVQEFIGTENRKIVLWVGPRDDTSQEQ